MHDSEFHKVAETVRGGFATPYAVSGVPGTLSGCIYRADGTKVSLSERMGGFMGDLLISSNPPEVSPPRSATSLPGRGVYLGNYMGGHYGHFITETLSSFWIFEDHQVDE